MLASCGARPCEVRLPAELEGLDGLIIPGGESTTIGRLMVVYGLLEPLRRFGQAGHPIWGTCAGLIVMAHEVGREQPLLDLMDMTVERNAFGRQLDSFETDLSIEGLAGGPLRAVFIRAPVVREVGPNVRVLGRLEDDSIVAVRQNHLLGTAFHPELTDDTRMHAMFVAMASAA
jgi:5'-phosphate synthase pdxT subunit